MIEAHANHLSTIPLWINLELPRELWAVDRLTYSVSLFRVLLGMNGKHDKYDQNKIFEGLHWSKS